jgi:hypothetical protein
MFQIIANAKTGINSKTLIEYKYYYLNSQGHMIQTKMVLYCCVVIFLALPGADAIKDDSPICPLKSILMLEPEKPKIVPESEWEIVVAQELLVRTYIKYLLNDSPVGLDGIFKLHKNHHGILQLCFMHPVTNRAFPFAYAIMRNADADSIEKFLSSVKKYLDETYKISWKPIMMIDKDAAERLACERLGFTYFLCNFHDSVTFTAAMFIHF